MSIPIIDKVFENSVNIVYATNNKYAKYMIVSLQSLIENSSNDRFYDVIVFSNDISESLQTSIKNLAIGYENFSIRILDVTTIYEDYNPENLFCHIYFSKDMYLRLFIPEVLQFTMCSQRL